LVETRKVLRDRVLFAFDVSCFHTDAQEHQQVCKQTSQSSALGPESPAMRFVQDLAVVMSVHSNTVG
jgi:hypothetical protein